MLTQDQQDLIVSKVNEKVNLPVLGEKPEKAIIKFVLKKLLALLEKELPEEFKYFINTAADGIVPGGEQGLTEVKQNISAFIDEKVNIPILGKNAEKEIITVIIDILFDALNKGKELKTA